MKSAQKPESLPHPDLDWQDSPSAIAEIWARRAASLAQVPPEPERGEQVELLLVQLARETYGFEARHAYDIRLAQGIARVPRVPAWVAGVTNLRGRILSVLDLAQFFGLSPDAEGQDVEGEGFLVAVETAQMELALLVDQVLAVEEIPLGQIKKATERVGGLPAEYVRGVYDRSIPSKDSGMAGNRGLVVILDLPVLLADERLIVDEKML
jgi:purine-binding chemotaxis protein CheW